MVNCGEGVAGAAVGLGVAVQPAKATRPGTNRVSRTAIQRRLIVELTRPRARRVIS